MLNEEAIGLSSEENFTYTWRDVSLYNLSVGARQLDYVYEKTIKMLPTFGTIPCTATFGTDPYHELPVSPISLIKDLPAGIAIHMDHKLTIHKPMPLSGTVHVKKVVTNVYDRGDKGAKLVFDVIAEDMNGEKLVTNTLGFMKAGCGNFGGKQPPVNDVKIPDRAADFEIEDAYLPITHLLHRLTGDTIPLHVDPAFAQKSGFKGPIIHGLCSFGFAGRLLVDSLFPEEPERLISIENQFRSVAMPGDAFVLHVWKIGDGVAVFRMSNKNGSGQILDNGRIYWK